MKQLDFDRAFPQTPDCIHAAIELGFRKGKKQMKMRNKIISLGSIAAAIAIMIAVAAFAAGGLGTPPKPDVLAQPEIKDIPKATEEPMVWCTKKGNYYHSDKHCCGMEGAVYGTLSYALALDKGPCPVCITAGAPVFMPTAAPIPESTKLPLNSDDQDFFEENPLDYLTEKGIYHHYDSDCCGITGAKPYIYEDAKAFNRLSCPVCDVAHEIVYYTDNGNYYHIYEDCSGMQNARVHQASNAAWDNKTPCPVCVIPYVYEIEMGERERTEEEMKRFYPFEGVDLRLDETVYTELSEKYFHIAEGCSDSPTIETTRLELAVGRSQLPCPVCVLNEEENYNLFKNTFGKEPYEICKEQGGFGLFSNPEMDSVSWHLGSFGNESPTLIFYDSYPGYNATRKLQANLSQEDSLNFFGNIETEPMKTLYGLAIEAMQKQLKEAGNNASSVWTHAIHVYFDDAQLIKTCEFIFYFEESGSIHVCFDAMDNSDWDMTITPNEGNTTVYAPYGLARYYHKTDVCNGQQNKRELTLADANMENLDPCPDCYGTAISEENAEVTDVVFYRTPNGKYYHLEPDCSGMMNAEACTPEKAIVNTGKHACPVCFNTEEKKALYMLPVPWGDADEVYVSADNDYYHIDPDCFNMIMVSKMDLKSAKGFEKTVCPVCMKEYSDFTSGEQEICWATRNGKYYHSDQYCSGMEHAVSGPVVEAQAMGKLRCPVCIELDLEDYDLFTTAFGQDISDLYYGYNYDHSVGREWIISNGTESFRLCEVYPEGTAFFGEELPGIPELHLNGLSADPEQVHVFMKNAPAPIGSMYTAAPAEVEKLAYKGNLTTEEVQLQEVKVYFDANRQVSSCEMQFGFYDHVKLAWKVGADGQIEMTQRELVRPEWDESSKKTTEEMPDEVIVSGTPSPVEFKTLSSPTLPDTLYQSAFGNLEDALDLGYGFFSKDSSHLDFSFVPKEENRYVLFGGGQIVLTLDWQENSNTSAFKYIMNVQLDGTREGSKRFMETVTAQPLASLYPQAVRLAKEHLASTYKKSADNFDPYVDLLMMGFDETKQLCSLQIDFRNDENSFGIEYTPTGDSLSSWSSRIII